MYMQRLKADREIGFNYHYMGYAEFEFGATRNGREALAQLALDGNITMVRTALWSKYGMLVQGPIDAVVLGRRQFTDTVGPSLTIFAEKAPMRLKDEDNLAWISVWGNGRTGEPLLVLRNVPDVLNRIDAFLNPFIEQLKAQSEN